MFLRVLLGLALVLAVSTAPVFHEAPGGAIKGQYIVVLKDDTDLQRVVDEFEVDAAAQNVQASILLRFQTLLTGFVAKFDEESVGLRLLMSLPGVEFVEQDKTIHSYEVVGSWGIDRIDQRNLPMDNDMTIDGYGADVNVYVIDTGVNPNHVDFGGRAAPVKDFVDVNGTGIDCNGHGTHCAGTVGSNTYGIARQANLYGIRILSCSGSGAVSSSVAALDWIGAEGKRPAVASMSYGGFYSPSEMRAAERAKELGVVLVAAAGNSNDDACRSSPAGSPDVITVGSTDSEDRRSSFSCWGPCVQLFAPGSSITSLAHDSNDGTKTYSGTSMACPHVAGIAAVLLGQGYSPQQVYAKIISSATLGKVINPNGTPNLLAYCS
ncbi:alkaline serine exoprotease A-like [Diadema antillarum]|uniref:alkaline serine exoprotease A-like n=1 Tax=Diadema antillarum TaxID=105358 RepID=UPI003A87E1AE